MRKTGQSIAIQRITPPRRVWWLVTIGAITLVAIAAGVYTERRRDARQQLTAAGAQFLIQPNWASQALGEFCPLGLEHILHVGISGSTATDQALRVLGRLPETQGLALRGLAVTGEFLLHVSPHRRLEAFEIIECPMFDDRYLDELSRVYPSLEILSLHGTPISDLGIGGLRRHERLRSLDLSATDITDGAREMIVQLPAVRDLNVSENRITDRFVVSVLDRLPLTKLIAGDTAISDRAILDASSSTLRAIGLAGTRITDEGLEALARFPALKVVDVRRCGVTASGIEALAARVPLLRIITTDGELGDWYFE